MLPWLKQGKAQLLLETYSLNYTIGSGEDGTQTSLAPRGTCANTNTQQTLTRCGATCAGYPTRIGLRGTIPRRPTYAARRLQHLLRGSTVAFRNFPASCRRRSIPIRICRKKEPRNKQGIFDAYH